MAKQKASITPKDTYFGTKWDNTFGETIPSSINAGDNWIGSDEALGQSYTYWLDNMFRKEPSAGDYDTEYTGKYDGKVDQLMSALESQNRQGFQYDYNTDPSYQAYRKEYLRNGQRATQDTMAAAAAMTGGRPSSYAATAAAQAGSNYAAQLSDKVPELYQQAYDRYLKQYQQQAQMLNAYQQQQQTDYNRFSQERSYKYNRYQDQIANRQAQQRLIMEQDNADREYAEMYRSNRVREMQTQQAQDWNRFLQQAEFALRSGDYGMLRDMGFDVTKDGFANDLAIAQIIAQVTGDTSMLRNLYGKG